MLVNISNFLLLLVMNRVEEQSVDNGLESVNVSVTFALLFCVSIGFLCSSLFFLYPVRSFSEKNVVSDGLRLHRDVMYFQVINEERDALYQKKMETLSFLESVPGRHSERFMTTERRKK